MADYTIMTDDELALACRCDNNAAWNELMTRYLPVIERYAFRTAGASSTEYDNLLSDGVFYGLCNAVKHFDPEKSSFSTFAGRCINNAMLNTLRRRYSQRRLPPELIVPIDSEVAALSDDDMQSQLEIREQLEEIRAKMEKILTKKEKQAFMLHIKGYSFAEVAEKLGTTQKSAETASARAVAKLRACFK